MDISRHEIPSGGWQFRQPQINWIAPTPLNSTFDQTVMLILQQRRKNMPAAVKYSLSLDPYIIGNELEDFTRKRLKLPGRNELPKNLPLSGQGSSAGVVAADSNVQRNSIAFNIKRAAQGTAVPLDWFTSGGKLVEKELAYKRAETCVNCPKNVQGAWYTESPAEIIRATLNLRPGAKIETPFDDRLKSCDVCKCLMRLKVWVPLHHILAKTHPEIMAEFPNNCWIAKQDQ